MSNNKIIIMGKGATNATRTNISIENSCKNILLEISINDDGSDCVIKTEGGERILIQKNKQ